METLIAKQQQLFLIAHQLSKENPSFDLNFFKQDSTNDRGLKAFWEDIQEVKYHNRHRFPTLIIKKPGQGVVMVTGHRPYPVLLDAINKISPGLRIERKVVTVDEYAQFWGNYYPVKSKQRFHNVLFWMSEMIVV